MKSKCKKALLVLLSVCMVLTMTPAAFATDTQAATEEGSGDSHVITADTTTLTGGTYTLSADVKLANGALTVPSGADVTLNLGVNRLTNKNGEDTIVVQLGGKLTIEGTGTVDNVSHGRAAIYNSGTVVLNGCTYDRSAENGQNKNSSGDNSYYTILNHGTMTINNGVAVTTAGGGENLSSKGRYSSLISNGYFSYTDTNPRNGYVATSNEAAPSLTISGGTFAGGLNTIKNDDGGNLTITGGTFSNFYQALVQNHNIAEITGGTFTAASDANGTIYGVDNCGCVATTDLGTLTISSGTFSGVTCGVWDRSSQPAQIAISGGTFTAKNTSVDKDASSNAVISITGGTFSSDVKEFVPQNYECKKAPEGSSDYVVSKMEDKLVITPDTSPDINTVSATLEGEFSLGATVEENGTAAEGSSVSGSNLTVDLTTPDEEGGNTTTTATLTVTADTAKSMATGGATLTVKSDVGTVSLPADAVKKMENANDEVTVSITKNTSSSGVEASYTVDVKSGDEDLLPEGTTDNGTITITVDKPADVEDEDLQAWYVVPNGDNLVYVEKLKTQIDGDQVAITIGHLSTIVLTDDDPQDQAVAKVTTVSDGTGTVTYYADFDDALQAVVFGGTVELLADVNMTRKLTVNGNVAIIGNDKTITGVKENAAVNFEVTSGTFTISDVTLKDFGSNAVTNSGIAVIKVDSSKSETKVVANDVNIEDFCRSAYDIRSGSFEITGGTIDSGVRPNGTESSSKLTKGILAGLGSGQVTGTITDVTITNSASNYADWTSGGIEIYENADVTINGGSITNVQNGISVDNYYDPGNASNKTGATVRVNDVTVDATKNAIRVYGNGLETNNETASVTVDGGSYTGDIAIVNGTTSEDSANRENIGVTGAVINGNIGTTGDGAIGIVNSTVTSNGGEPAYTGVTFVNTKVDGELRNSVANGKEAMVNGVLYDTLVVAVEAAKNGDIVTLLSNVTLDGAGKGNDEGLLTITKDIILDGGGKTITAKDVNVTGSDGPSMINIENGANVTVRNLTIDGKGVKENAQDNTKHGLNIYGAGTSVTVENVTIKNGNGYAIVANGSTVTVDGLITENNSWGGINVDSKSGAASLTIKDADMQRE